MEKLKVLIYGAGAVGIYFGGKLTKAGHQVTFVDLPNKADRLDGQKLNIRSRTDKDFEFQAQVISDLATLEPQDLILVAVKAYLTYEIALHLLPVLHPDSMILSLQNGLENERILADILGENMVMGTVPFFNGTLADERTLIQNAQAKLIFGELDHQPSEREEWLSQILSHAEIPHSISRNIWVEIWKNFLWNNAYNTIGALTKTTVGQISRCEPIQATLHQMMIEGREVAMAEGVTLSDQDLEELKNLTPSQNNYKSTLLQDMESGRKPELEPLAGTLLRLAKKHDIAAPVNRTIYNLIQLNMSNYSFDEEV